MSEQQGSGEQRKTSADHVSLSRDDFRRAVRDGTVEQVRRLLEIDSSLVNEPFHDQKFRCKAPPLLCAIMDWDRNSSADRSVLELIALVRVLLEFKADINAQEKGIGRTPLHWAVVKNSVELVKFLLQSQAQVDVRDTNGHTPLMGVRSVEMARLLIANGADVKSQDNNGLPVWKVVMRYCRDLETFKVLTHHGIGLHETYGKDARSAIHHAARYSRLEIMEYLLDQGFDVNARTAKGQTPLHLAVRGYGMRNVFPLVQALVQRGADVNATDHDGQSPFASIRTYSHGVADTKVAKLLIDNGADISKNVKTFLPNSLQINQRSNLSIMELILEQEKLDLNARDSDDSDTLAFELLDRFADKITAHERLFRLLIKHGADVKARHRRSGRTLLHFAVAGSKLIKINEGDEFDSEVQALLEKGSDINAADNEGWTPILLASYHRNWKIVRMLVEHRADVNIALDGITPLSLACKRNEASIVQLLLEAGAQVDYRLKDGVTALLICVRNGFVGCSALLLQRGADIHAADSRGHTPLILACKKGKLDMIYNLIRLSPHHRRRTLPISDDAKRL